jgi:hypothetical protein
VSLQRRALLYGTIAAVLAIAGFAEGQSAARQVRHESAREQLIGAWRLVRIEAPGPGGKPVAQPQGMLIYTRDGHMSVQLMYPATAGVPSNEYVRDGYEASFGSFEVDEASHTVTHHVQGSITRDLLVGKDLPRVFQFTADGRLVIRPARPDEHWSVTWKHY